MDEFLFDAPCDLRKRLSAKQQELQSQEPLLPYILWLDAVEQWLRQYREVIDSPGTKWSWSSPPQPNDWGWFMVPLKQYGSTLVRPIPESLLDCPEDDPAYERHLENIAKNEILFRLLFNQAEQLFSFVEDGNIHVEPPEWFAKNLDSLSQEEKAERLAERAFKSRSIIVQIGKKKQNLSTVRGRVSLGGKVYRVSVHVRFTCLCYDISFDEAYHSLVIAIIFTLPTGEEASRPDLSYSEQIGFWNWVSSRLADMRRIVLESGNEVGEPSHVIQAFNRSSRLLEEFVRQLRSDPQVHHKEITRNTGISRTRVFEIFKHAKRPGYFKSSSVLEYYGLDPTSK